MKKVSAQNITITAKQNIINFLTHQKIPYKNIEIYITAFTHTSFTNESGNDNDLSNQRLEFLGDSVIGFVVADHIYNIKPAKDEGEMTILKSQLVKKEYLSNVSRGLELHELVRLGQGEKRYAMSNSMYEDIFEAFVGAIYLDLGINYAKKALKKYILDNIEELSNTGDLKDYKTRLQEHFHSILNQPINYDTRQKYNKENPSQPLFEARVYFDEKLYGLGKGHSKKDAEQQAAKSAYDKMVK